MEKGHVWVRDKYSATKICPSKCFMQITCERKEEGER